MDIDREALIEAVALELKRQSQCEPQIPWALSARHLHLAAADFEILFGPGATLTPWKPLSQPGQFAAEEKVALVSPSLRTIEGVRILGPLRSHSQVELSATDARSLAMDPPLRESGVIGLSAPVTIVGPAGSVSLREGCIIARRHIHFTPAEAERFGVGDNQVVSVLVEGPRGGVLGEVLCRVSPRFALELHVDTDEANALGMRPGTIVRLKRGERG